MRDRRGAAQRTRQLRFPSQEITNNHPILAFDLNGVLADADTKLIQEIKKQFNITIDPHEMVTYDFLLRRLIEATNNYQVGSWIKKTVNSPDFILSLDTLPGTRETWVRLKKLPVQLRIVTGHDPVTQIPTERWCLNYGFDAKIDFTKYKDAWVRQTQCKWLVEDSPRHALACAEQGVKVLLVDKSYNQEIEDENIIRISDVLEIPEIIWQDVTRE